MFLNLDKKFLFYIDSVGKQPPKQIKTLVNRILKQAKNLDIKLNYSINKVKHQSRNTECGVYSIFFVTEFLKNKFPHEFDMILPDSFMEQYRNIFFDRDDNKVLN